MRHVWLLCLAVLASCSQAPTDEQGRAGRGAPGVDVTAAPGVAFTYRYAFRLPGENIAQAQEVHAQACEKLGASRCRVTGMAYSVSGEDDVSGSLSFKLDPAIARAFGRDGVAAIEQAQGMLASAAITGTDAAADAASAEAGVRRTAAERDRLDREVAARPTGDAARAELLRQRAALDADVRDGAQAAAQARASLATTPMTFDYVTGPAVRGFNARSPLVRAADMAVASAQFTLSMLLNAIALLGPPALALALLWLGWRAVGRAWWARLKGPSAAP